MLYAVAFTVSQDDWHDSIGGSLSANSASTESDQDEPTLPPAIYRTAVRRALRQQHEWLAARGITALIRPNHASQRDFTFYFDDEEEAHAFRQAFGGADVVACPTG